MPITPRRWGYSAGLGVGRLGRNGLERAVHGHVEVQLVVEEARAGLGEPADETVARGGRSP